MARGPASDAGSAFDDVVAFAPGHLPVQGPADAVQPAGFLTAFDVAMEAGIPAEVAKGFLDAMGAEHDIAVDMLCDFDPEDVALARRSFGVIHPDTGEGAVASPVQRSYIAAWLRAAKARLA